MNSVKIFVLLFFVLSSIGVFCQDELKWKDEIDELNQRQYDFDNNDEIIVLTGSSSARFWTNISDYFPEKTIVNNGFGGSQMHELLFFVEDLILKHKPTKVFIYEGDNDISAGKTKEQILKTTLQVVSKIKESLPKATIYFISPKPSIARWELKARYIELNTALKSYCETTEMVEYIDVWYPMLDKDGMPIKEIFISDGLHMNKKGYDIWAKQVGPHLK